MTMPCTFMQDFFCLSVLKHISICVIDLSGVFEKKIMVILRFIMFSKYFDWFLSGFVKKMVDQFAVHNMYICT
jgi:hypothetical protein